MRKGRTAHMYDGCCLSAEFGSFPFCPAVNRAGGRDLGGRCAGDEGRGVRAVASPGRRQYLCEGVGSVCVVWETEARRRGGMDDVESGNLSRTQCELKENGTSNF